MNCSFYACTFCGARKYSLPKFIRHLQLYHQQQPNFTVTCGISGCCNKFVRVESWRKHIQRKHRINQVIDKSDATEIDSNEVLEESDDLHSDEIAKADLCMSDVLSTLQKHMAMFVLNLQEKHSLAKKVRETVVDDLKGMFGFFTENFCDVLRSQLTECGFNWDCNPHLTDNLNGSVFNDSVFDHVSSEYKLQQFCKQHLGMVEPDEYILGVDCKGKKETFQYVPLLKLIRFLFEHGEFADAVAKQTEIDAASNDGLLRSFRHGRIYQNHPLLSTKSNCIAIHLYNDEFEVVNPLGSKKLLHKVSAFYCVLGNLSEKYRSQLRHVYLVTMVRYKWQQKHGYRAVLEPLIRDLKLLAETGVAVRINNVPGVLFGALATISADNLSAHALAGFSSCFNSGRICRYCMAHYDDIQKKFSESEFVIRSQEAHLHHLRKLKQDSQAASIYGVYRDCPFSDLDYFCTVNAFPPDVMHDVLEGVVPLVLKLTIQHLHAGGIVTISQLNQHIESFEFGRNDRKSKPVKISVQLARNESALHGKASEKWCLFRTLPFMIGTLVPEHNQNWKLYISAREIVDYILSPTAEPAVTNYLRLLIETFLEEFAALYPGKITPKMHFLMHYPRLIAEFGPLQTLWCMRFEAKHLYFKRIASGLNNFRNISQTFARRHQMKQCWEFTSLDLMKQDEQIEGVTTLKLKNLATAVRSPVTNFLEEQSLVIAMDDEVTRVKSLRWDNVTYCVSDLFVVDMVHDEKVPVFFKIVCILKVCNIWLLCGKLCFAKQFNSHIWAYQIDFSDDMSVIKPGDELDYHPLDAYLLDSGESFVALRYIVNASV